MQAKGKGLEERTAQFAARVVNVCEAIPSERLKSGHLKDQLFRAGTSVAANYAEAEEPESREDFVHKMKLAMKELKESRVWSLFASRLAPGEAVESLRAESRELLLMAGKSINTASARMQGKTIGA